MGDQEPHLNLTHEDQDIYFGRSNTALYKYFGEWATHDHIFILIETGEEEKDEGLYVFKTHDMYGSLAKFIVENGFIMHLNLPEPTETDQRVWERAHYKDIEGTQSFPEDWNQDAA